MKASRQRKFITPSRPRILRSGDAMRRYMESRTTPILSAADGDAARPDGQK